MLVYRRNQMTLKAQLTDWLKLEPEFPQATRTKPAKDGDKVARKLADALDRERELEAKFRRSFNAWDKARRTTLRLEKELDKLSDLAK
jgi:hypothetical protein